MDSQSTAQGDSNQPKNPHRRRIAIAAALVMMGAVIIDPALLEDMNVSVQLGGKLPNGEPMDEFAQIELMLSQSENSSRTATAPAAETVTPQATQSDVVEDREPTQIVSAGVLMIPNLTSREETAEYAAVTSPELTEAAAVISPIFNTQALELPTITTPASISESSGQLPAASQIRPSRNIIRLTGTIAPIQ